ncbi:MAG: hypothetical protein ABI743_01810 [bacterium]
MSDDNSSGPYRRDKQGRRTAPEDRNRKAFWWEWVVFFIVRYFWLLIIAIIAVAVWRSMTQGHATP